MVKLNRCIFWLKIKENLKNIMIFGIKSEIVFKKNLITNTTTMKFF